MLLPLWRNHRSCRRRPGSCRLWHQRWRREGSYWVRSFWCLLPFTSTNSSLCNSEYFWTPGHSSLFRICESSSTSSKPFQLHTCNVFRPNHPVDAPPLHSFVESVRSWESSGHATQGRAVRIESYRLDSLLLNEGLKCSPSSTAVPQNGVGTLDARAQLVIGDVGQAYFAQKMAIACNYDRMGRNVQTWCARYGDGGQMSAGKPHPLTINQIFTKHFAMNCTWAT